MHSRSIYRYYAKHRAAGWRRAHAAARLVALRLRAELAWLRGKDREAMKAVVLVGGEGTRLRPLTETIPKQLLPLVDRPILDHMLDRLVRHGVNEVVMSSPYLEEAFRPFIEGRGAARRHHLDHRTRAARDGRRDPPRPSSASASEPFFAMNGDILTDLDLTAMLAVHRERTAPMRRSRCTTSRTPATSDW